ncbi:MAG: polyprenyl synthetase family protein [Candidatus Hydrogenedentes bacterium]|nr:polyprenyl synthetase family protein [Candidatus Hydrogenedentota bacterium]
MIDISKEEYIKQTVEQYLREKSKIVDEAMQGYLASVNGSTEVLIEAMKYSLFAGGKRFRPTLVFASVELFDGDLEKAKLVASAIEMIHTYSLIHDDLPALDNDDFRRGKPTLHKVYGEAIALLAGDGLLTLAFELLGRTGHPEVVVEVAGSAGIKGMVGGQFMDLEAEGKQIPLQKLKEIHRLKTGSLITVSLRAGALISNAEKEDIETITEYGENLGIAFQIVDDILNVVGDAKKMGKPTGTDEKNKKSTYPFLLGVDKSRELALDHIKRAVDSLHKYDTRADPLRNLAWYVIYREK